jgi:HEXXH motif-containing protein
VFLPSSILSPLALDTAMRTALADSLAHIHAVTAESINLTDVLLASGMSAIKAHRVAPGVFGRYYDLVFAVHAKRYEDASALFHEIVALSAKQPGFAALPFTEQALGADKERYARLLGLEAGSAAALSSPAHEDWLAFKANLAAALMLIEKADFALAAELRTLVIQIVAAASNSQSGSRAFGGASSFMLWGAVTLNVEQHRTRLDMIAGLVHEAAHQVLFGLSIDEPLVGNSIEERYGSPLRTDSRPMDGVYHATFVCARMHYAYLRLKNLGKNNFDHEERDLVEQRLSDYRQKFFEGFDTVERFGRLSANGRRIMDAAAAYMRTTN